MIDARIVAAVVCGAALAATPFLRYRLGAPHPTAHMDHRPRHGGVLAMVGDQHLEVRRGGGEILVWPSDAHRRPLHARGAWIEHAGGARQPLVADDRGDGDPHLRAPDPGGPVVCFVDLGGEPLRLDVP